YQRVGAATDYDTAGFPPYLAFDGVDDCLFTAGNVEFATWTGVEARRNLFLVPSQFDATNWIKTRTTVTANTTTAPDGTSTADALFETAVTNTFSIQQNLTSTLVPHTFSVRVKANGRNVCVLYDAFRVVGRYFDITPGTAGAVGNIFGGTPTSASITPLGNDWFLCSITYTPTGTNVAPRIDLALNGTTFNYAGDPTKGVFLWGAQLELGTTATAFQNVGTDQVTVVAGVRKLSDAAFAPMPELGAISDTTNGTFGLFFPWTNGTASYGFQSRGTAAAGASVTNAIYAAPQTRVLAALGAVSSDASVVRLNSAQVATNTGDQGTGNYSNQALFLGARNNASNRFNGRLYSLIVTGRVLTTPTLEQSEAWMNQRTRAY
ncbi:MAG: phage head spike fiber domain-containing protein, partial [Burkholderiaceae bacterium]